VNATLKSIQQLIYSQDKTLSLAAIRILGEVNSREPALHKSLADLMIETEDPEIFESALAAIENSPHEQILKQLIRVLDKTEEYQARIIEAIARMGSKVIPVLRQQFDKSSAGIQRCIVRILPRIRSHLAHVFLVDCLANTDLHLMREAIRILRVNIGEYSATEKADLFGLLVPALEKHRQNESTVSAIVIAMGIVGDIKAKDCLLAFITPVSPPQVRRHALISLAQLPLAAEPHSEVATALLPLLDDPDYEGLVRHVITVLALLPPSRDNQAVLQNLLKNRHTGVKVFAMDKLAALDSPENAQLILDFIPAGVQDLKEAALAALARMPSSVNIILKAIDDNSVALRIQDLAKILGCHRNGITAERARNRIRRMLEQRDGNDKRFDLNWEAIRQLKPDLLRAEMLKLADAAFAESNYREAAFNLGLLGKGGLLNPELRYKLMLASLKISGKSRSRGNRASDPALEYAAGLLAGNPREFKSRLLAEDILTDEDFLYLGFHFSERLNEERRFGADLLRHLIAHWPRRRSAALARQKLSLEGHQGEPG
jgi:hypothetical protein